jgi:hypothetical protein
MVLSVIATMKLSTFSAPTRMPTSPTFSCTQAAGERGASGQTLQGEAVRLLGTHAVPHVTHI